MKDLLDTFCSLEQLPIRPRKQNRSLICTWQCPLMNALTRQSEWISSPRRVENPQRVLRIMSYIKQKNVTKNGTLKSTTNP